MSRRSYAQQCPIALALDTLGDRWALLILRELRIGPRRFTDIRTALPGIAPNRARLHVDGRCVDIVTAGADLELQMAGPSAPDIEVTTTVADLVTARQGGALCLPPRPASTRFARLFSLETSEP